MGDPDSSLTPEQRLLKLIEEPESAPDGGAGQGGGPQKGGGKYEGYRVLDLATLIGLVTEIKDRIQTWVKGEGTFNLRVLIWPIRILAVVLFFSLLASLGVEYLGIERRLRSFSKIEQRERARTADESTKSVSVDEDQRNIFVPANKEETPSKESGQASVALIEMTKDLKLTGISADPNNPKRTFCMIEDIKKNLTSFLKEGDTINGMKVESISSDEVVMVYNQEKIELR